MTRPRRAGKRIPYVTFLGSSILGIALVAVGVFIDVLPGTTPGVNLPQLVLIAGGVILTVVSIALRHDHRRRRLIQEVRRHVIAGAAVAILTLLALELVLGLMSVSTYFPGEIPERFLNLDRWSICDEAGCHYRYEILKTACENGEASGRYCVFNRQGFHDTQDFYHSSELQDTLRILMLGDSFTYGETVPIGESFVERLEAEFPESTIWNTAIKGIGTEQSLRSFRAYAPLLQPQLTILGFYINDLRDNLDRLRGYVEESDSGEQPLLEWHDFWGNIILVDQPTMLYYRSKGIDPPASELERVVGRTRLGSVTLRLIDSLAEAVAENVRERRELEVTRQYLTELRDEAAEIETTLLILLIPNAEDLATPSESFNKLVDLVRSFGFAYINPREDLEADDYNSYDIHWNSAGHGKIAEILTRCVRSFAQSQDLGDCDRVIMP